MTILEMIDMHPGLPRAGSGLTLSPALACDFELSPAEVDAVARQAERLTYGEGFDAQAADDRRSL